MSQKTEHQQRVDQFLRGIGRAVPLRPGVADRELLATWGRLLLEEAFEWLEAAGLDVWWECEGVHGTRRLIGPIVRDEISVEVNEEATPDLVAMADACADVSVVNTGAMSICGMGDVSLLKLVDDNNLLKVATGKTCPTTGKFLKPKDHPKPDFAGVLKTQGWTEQ